MMSAALKWQNTFITVISHYKKNELENPHTTSFVKHFPQHMTTI